MKQVKSMSDGYVLEMRNITKTFPGVKALDNVSFNLRKGEVHALIGENGAGKSTLIKILGGLFPPDSGEIYLDSAKMNIHSPLDSINKKISIIYQEFNLVPTLSIGENIFLGKEIKQANVIDRKLMNKKSDAIIKDLGLSNIDCSSEVSELSVAQQQMVEIAKALFNDSNIIVMDEPTAVLTQKESEALFEIIDNLKNNGVSIIYISHRLEEVQQLSDRITVFRDGQFITEIDNKNKDTDKETMVKQMVGRDLVDYFPERIIKPEDDVVLDVDGITKDGMFYDINFQLHKGEILGFFGLVGAGRTEVMKSIFGEISPDNGSVKIDGKEVKIKDPSTAIKNNIILVPEDRKKEGLVLIMSLADNIALPNPNLVSKTGVLNKKKKHKLAKKYVESLQIRPAIADREAGNFSGGNQQKIVIGKWLATKPRVIILDEPTRGIDIGAKREIYDIINQLTEEGVSVIVVSSEMLEVLGICDRVLIMHEGRINGEFKQEDCSQESLMACAAGIV